MEGLRTIALAPTPEVEQRVSELFGTSSEFDLMLSTRTQLEMAEHCIVDRPDVIVLEAFSVAGLRVLVETMTEGRPVTTIAILNDDVEPNVMQRDWMVESNVSAFRRSVWLRTDQAAVDHVQGRLARAAERQESTKRRQRSSLDLDAVLDEEDDMITRSRPAMEVVSLLDAPLRAAVFVGGRGATESMVEVMKKLKSPDIPIILAFEEATAAEIATTIETRSGKKVRVLQRTAQWRELRGVAVVPTDQEISIARTGVTTSGGKPSAEALLRWLPEDRSVALILISDDERHYAQALRGAAEAGRVVFVIDPMVCRYTRGPMYLATSGAEVEVLTPGNLAHLLNTAARAT